MILINRTKFGLFDKSQNKPKNSQHFIHYKDDYYTSGKFTYPISIFLDIVDSFKEELGHRYLLQEDDGKYLLFMQTDAMPIKLEQLEEQMLLRISLFSSGLETVNFDLVGFSKTDPKDIQKAIKKMPKVSSRYGFVYTAVSVVLIYFGALGLTNSIFGLLEEQVAKKNLTLTELKIRYVAENAEFIAMGSNFSSNTGALNLELPKQSESFVSRALRGVTLEQKDVNTTIQAPKEAI